MKDAADYLIRIKALMVANSQVPRRKPLPTGGAKLRNWNMLLDWVKQYPELSREVEVERFRVVGASYELRAVLLLKDGSQLLVKDDEVDTTDEIDSTDEIRGSRHAVFYDFHRHTS